MNEIAPAFRLQLFGGPEMHNDLGKCRLSPFQLALLTLVYSEDSIPRPRVARILWRREADSRTRQSIRQLRHGIGRRIGRPVIAADGDLLGVVDSIPSDLQQHRDALEKGRLLEAAGYIDLGFADRPLNGVGGEFEDWRYAFAKELKRRLWLAAVARWETDSRGTDWPGARDAAEAMYLLAADDEEVVARVIEARARVGKVPSAEAAYTSYAEGRAGQQRSELIEEIIARVRMLRDETGEGSRQAVVPFVGRRKVLGELSPVFSDVRAGTFSFVLIRGEPGIGKTRLLRELERTAHLEGIRCLRAQPSEFESRISLNPILDALGAVDLQPHLAALGEPWRTVIGSMLPADSLEEPVGELPPIEEGSLSRRLLDAFSLLLEQLAIEQPTVLFLDDLHWADATTIAALQFFQRRWSESAFGVFATIRPDIVRGDNPVAQYLSNDGKHPVRSVELGEMGEDEARQLIELVGDGQIEEGVVQKLFALAGLHPLYLTELARDFLAGRLRIPDLPADQVHIPVSLKQILAARTERISPNAARVAGILAVASRAMRLTDIARLVDLSLDQAADAADELKATRLVELDRDEIWIAHDLFRSALYNELSESRRVVLHRKLAEHLQTDGPHGSAGELSIHFDRAGEASLSATHGWTAAERALERGAVAEAAHFYELVTRNESDEMRRAEATARLATSLHLNRNISRANPALELASSRLRTAGMVEQARRMDIRRVEGLAEARDTPVDELVERLGAIKAESRAAEDWEAVALALDVELQLLQLGEQFEEVRGRYSELAEVIAVGSRSAVATAHLGLAVGMLFDEPAKAVHSAHEAVRLTDAISADKRLKALNRLLIVFFHHGLLHLEEHQPLISEAETLAQKSGDLLQRFAFESNMGAAFMDAGDLDRGEVLLARASNLLGSADMTFPRINLACNLGELALAKSDFEGATAAFTSAGTHLGPTIPRYTSDFVSAGLGLCALEGGSLTEARRREQELGEAPAVWYYDPTIIMAFRARLLERRGDRGQAVELVARVSRDLEGRLVMAWLKMRALQVRLMLRGRFQGAYELAEEALSLARQLNLRYRAFEFEELCSRASNQ